MRVVTFRLAENEFDALVRVCKTEAFRSMSDFAREAVMQKVESYGSGRALLSEDLTMLGVKLEELDRDLRDLRHRIGRILGSPRNEED